MAKNSKNPCNLKEVLKKRKNPFFSIEKAHISELFVLIKLINGQYLKMHVLDQKQSVLALPNFHINAKNWSKNGLISELI